jgi:hypothetical protein
LSQKSRLESCELSEWIRRLWSAVVIAEQVVMLCLFNGVVNPYKHMNTNTKKPANAIEYAATMLMAKVCTVLTVWLPMGQVTGLYTPRTPICWG